MIFWCRRWIEHSRSPRWIKPAVGVAEDLDLDVAAARQIALEKDPIVAEAAGGLAPGGGDGLGELRRLLHDPHALAAAAGRGLHEQRVADVAGLGGILGDRQRRHAQLERERLRRQLVAHPLDGLGRGAHPGEPGRDHVGGKARVLGQEAVARDGSRRRRSRAPRRGSTSRRDTNPGGAPPRRPRPRRARSRPRRRRPPRSAAPSRARCASRGARSRRGSPPAGS